MKQREIIQEGGMTIADRATWFEGKGYWGEYVRVNGYSWEPTVKGLQKLARLLDLNISYLRKHINFYLEN